jgi:hypothetical protein
MLRIATCRALAVALALAVLAGAAAPAWATYPGRNGWIVVLRSFGGHYMQQQYWIDLFHPRGAPNTRFAVCSSSFAHQSPPYCDRVGPVFLSRSGLEVGMVAFAQADTGTPSALLYRALGEEALLGRVSISESQPSWGIGWDANGLPHPVPRPEATDPRQASILRYAREADWAGDGRVAFESGALGEPGQANIYAGPPAGPFRRLIRGGQDPSWSPHGRSIAFARNGGVYVVPSHGGKARRVVRPPQVNHLVHPASPVWSPDGKQIAFYRQGVYGKKDPIHTLNLYTLTLKTGKLRRLASSLMTDDAYDDSYVEGPLWQALPRR